MYVQATVLIGLQRRPHLSGWPKPMSGWTSKSQEGITRETRGLPKKEMVVEWLCPGLRPAGSRRPRLLHCKVILLDEHELLQDVLVSNILRYFNFLHERFGKKLISVIKFSRFLLFQGATLYSFDEVWKKFITENYIIYFLKYLIISLKRYIYIYLSF